MRPPKPRFGDERGAILIHVAIAFLVLGGCVALALDYGVMWVSRTQAQNAADSGAMAGAVALAFDNFDDRTDTGPAKVSAMQTSNLNPVWGQSASVLASDVTFPTCPDGTNACIRVDVFRNRTRGNALPVFFGSLIGLRDQGVRATATAEAAIANASDCLKPWAVPDKWQENNPVPQPPIPWSDAYTFDAYDKKGVAIANPDVYIPPTSPGTTGYTIANDYGTQLTLKAGSPHDAIAPGWFFPVDLPRVSGPITGGDRYRENIASCNSVTFQIGDPMQNEPGNMIGPTKQGVEDLIALDPHAVWDPTLGGKGGVSGGCLEAGTCTKSPRMVALPIFDVDLYAKGQVSGRQDIKIVNILGFFIERMNGNDVVGRLMYYPGILKPGPQPQPGSAFPRTVMLVR